MKMLKLIIKAYELKQIMLYKPYQQWESIHEKFFWCIHPELDRAVGTGSWLLDQCQLMVRNGLCQVPIVKQLIKIPSQNNTTKDIKNAETSLELEWRKKI